MDVGVFEHAGEDFRVFLRSYRKFASTEAMSESPEECMNNVLDSPKNSRYANDQSQSFFPVRSRPLSVKNPFIKAAS